MSHQMETIFDTIVNIYIPMIRWASVVVFFIGLGYMLWGWVKRKPTSLMLGRVAKTGALRQRLVSNIVNTLITNISLQAFIVRRSYIRWLMHFFIFVGGGGLVILHALPLMFGSQDSPWFVGMLDPETSNYHYLFLGLLGAGAAIAIMRRILREDVPADLDTYNLVPITLITMIVTTGYITGFLIPELETISGWTTSELECFNIVHIISVYATLAAFPFTKFFHFFIRWLAFPVNLYVSYAEGEEQRLCANCGKPFASDNRMRDIQSVVGELSEGWLLSYCPKCRRIINARLDRAQPSIIRPEVGQ
jgi:heterodisulfide reductase subunit E